MGIMTLLAFAPRLADNCQRPVCPASPPSLFVIFAQVSNTHAHIQISLPPYSLPPFCVFFSCVVLANASVDVELSDQVSREQEIRNPLLHRIFVPAAPAHQRALLYARLQQYAVEVFRRLTRLLVCWLCALGGFLDAAFDQVVWCWCAGRQVGEPELVVALLVFGPGAEGRSRRYLFADCAQLFPH